MSRILYRIILLNTFLLACAGAAMAQVVPDSYGHAHEVLTDGSGHVVCGTEWMNDGKEAEALAKTAQNKPELYRQMLAYAKSDLSRSVLSSAEEYPFFIRDRKTGEYNSISGTLVFQGKFAWIWIDNADVGKVSQNSIKQLARGLDSVTGAASRNPKKGIIENEIDVFGQPPSTWALEGVTHFLLTDIKDGFEGLGGSFVAGYFSPYDQTDKPGSNRLNLLYIDSKEGLGSGITNVLSTLAHEFQHLIHYNTNPESDIVFNEGASEVASIIVGYKSRGNGGFLSGVTTTNVDLFAWHPTDPVVILADYERAMTLVYYLYEQFGEAYMTAFNSTRVEGITRISEALKRMGASDTDWQSVMKGFAVANYAQQGINDSRYVYKVKLGTTKPKVTLKHTGADFPTTGTVQVQTLGSAYLEYVTPGGMKAKFTSFRPFEVLALLYKGTSVVQVQSFKNNEEIVLGESTPYDKIVFVIVNLNVDGGATVEWTLQGATLGVEDEAAAAGFAVEEIAPNPAVGPASISFRTDRPGAVRMEIFNVGGTNVRTVVDGKHYEAGSHRVDFNVEGLPNNLYIVRLTMGDRIVTRAITVVR